MQRITRIYLACLLGVILWGAGCGASAPSRPGAEKLQEGTSSLPAILEETARPVQDVALERKVLADGIEHITYAFSTTTRARLELYMFPQDRYRFRLASAEAGQSLAAWRDGSPVTVVAGINGMYFLEDLSPAGFFVASGMEQRARVFDWDKSALLTIADDGNLAIRATTKEPEDLAELTQAAQSYPLLILNGKPVLTEDSGKMSRRSLVGTEANGRVWIGVVVDGDVSLYRLGQILMEMAVPWQHVLNLDGGASSGLFIRGANEVMFPSFTPVPNVLLVEER